MSGDCISVVLPIYNVEKYLDRCINSIVNQTYRNLEIILVDDGSPDNCPSMCDAWADRDSRIRVIHKKNAGLGMARNTGIEHATGAYICFFDSDDYIAENAIQEAYECICGQAADIVVFGFTDVDSSGREIRKRVPKQASSYCHEQVTELFLPQLISSDIKGNDWDLFMSAWVCLYSKKAIDQANWRFVSEREIISEDIYSLLDFYRYVNKVAILPKSLYFYCENNSSLSRTFRGDRLEKTVHFYRECLALIERHTYNDKVKMSISSVMFSTIIAAMKQIDAADLEPKQKRMLLKQIIDDADVQLALKDVGYQYKSSARNVLSWAMRNKRYAFVRFLIKIRGKRKRYVKN